MTPEGKIISQVGDSLTRQAVAELRQYEAVLLARDLPLAEVNRLLAVRAKKLEAQAAKILMQTALEIAPLDISVRN